MTGKTRCDEGVSYVMEMKYHVAGRWSCGVRGQALIEARGKIKLKDDRCCTGVRGSQRKHISLL